MKQQDGVVQGICPDIVQAGGGFAMDVPTDLEMRVEVVTWM